MQKFAATLLTMAGVAQANYLSGEVRSQEWFHYGKFVAKVQNPGKMGTVQSFFTYTAQDWPHGWNEIDVEVVPSVTENPFSMNIIWKDGAQDHNYATGFHPGTEWFTYTVEWTPEYVSWFVNDKLVRKSEGTEDVHFLDMSSQLMMNFWTPTWSPWNDYFDDAEMPWYAKYDYVEVYDYDLSSKDFKLRWRDDFNTWDTKKWYASDNWGFENNSSLFMSSQVYVEDGSLVLKMDYNDGHAREFPEHHEVTHHEKPLPEQPHHNVEHHAAKAPHEVEGHVVEKTVYHHDVPHHAEVPHGVGAHSDITHFESLSQAHHEAVPVHATAAAHHVQAHALPEHHEAVPVHATAAAHHVQAHAVPQHHEAVPAHHEPAHLESLSQTHYVAPIHEAVDIHRYEAPLIHQQTHYVETGYPHHYSEAQFETVGHDYSVAHHGYSHGEPELVHGETHPFKHGHSEGPHGAHTYETIKYEPIGYPEHHIQQEGHHVYTAPAQEYLQRAEIQYEGHHDTEAAFLDRQGEYLHDAYPLHGESSHDYSDFSQDHYPKYYQ